MKKIFQTLTILIFLILMGITALRADPLIPYNYQNIEYIKVFLPPFIFQNTEPWVKRFSTQEAWLAFYSKMAEEKRQEWSAGHYVNEALLPPPPTYDFEHYDLVIGGMGPKKETYLYDAAYLLLIQDVAYFDEQAHIFLHEIFYSTCSAFIDFGITHPSSIPQAILIRKTIKPISFYIRKTVEQSTCPEKLSRPVLTLP